MTKEQRIAISRVISDMIKADSIIEESEILDMKRMMIEYSLSHNDMEQARQMKFSDALSILKELPSKARQQLVERVYGIARSDNECAPREALLLIALHYCLIDEERGKSKATRPMVLSCVTGESSLNDQYMVYIESAYNEIRNREIEQNFRLLVTLSRLCGFNFIYIPRMVTEFRSMKSEYVLDVIRYMSPSLDDAFIRNVYDRLCNMTTVEFFNNVLYERLQVRVPIDIGPSLLINIGTSVVPYCSVGGPVQYYTEFLCLPLSGNVLSEVDGLLGQYQSRVSVRQTISLGDGQGQFKYFGFYKALFDFLIAPPPLAPDLIFMGQDMASGRYQVAFRFDDDYEKRIDLTPKEYEVLLKVAKMSVCPGQNGMPVGMVRGIRPVISHLRAKISHSVPDLTFIERYKPVREGNFYRLRLDGGKIFVCRKCAMGVEVAPLSAIR